MNKFILKVQEEEEGIRLDVFLATKLDLTRSRIQSLIKDGNIEVNGKHQKASYKIEKDDGIEVAEPEAEVTEIMPENIPIDIVYQDNDIAVINKQAGLVVHPAQGHSSGTLVNALMYHMKDLSGINGEIRPGIVHRLDKDTSGLMIIAKNDRAHISLASMFQEKKVKKTYLAILKGKVAKKEGTIITNIGRDKNERKKMAVMSSEAGKDAITSYRVIAQNELYTLVQVGIMTGRTHQIRVHMKHLGYPVLGDAVYGRKDSEKRQMLHAFRLEFAHPVTGKDMEFQGRLPEDFIKVLKKNDFNNEEMKELDIWGEIEEANR